MTLVCFKAEIYSCITTPIFDQLSYVGCCRILCSVGIGGGEAADPDAAMFTIVGDACLQDVLDIVHNKQGCTKYIANRFL